VKKAESLVWLALVVVTMGVACVGSPESNPSSAPASGNSIGVPECDDYLSKVEACIADHVPEDAKAMQRQSMEQMRTQWRQAAENATAKASLAAGCKAALDAARSSFAAYGCQW
jgi:hypothetical protein